MPKYSYHRGIMRNPAPYIIGVAVILCAVIIYVKTRPQPVIPLAITKKAAFNVTTPDNNYVVVPNSATYINQSGVLSYKAVSAGITYSVNEQATPQTFTDSPQVYPALLNKMQEYSEIQTGSGTVALTRPKELNGAQTAVLNAKGDLIFVRPSENLSNQRWKDFFDSLQW